MGDFIHIPDLGIFQIEPDGFVSQITPQGKRSTPLTPDHVRAMQVATADRINLFEDPGPVNKILTKSSPFRAAASSTADVMTINIAASEVAVFPRFAFFSETSQMAETGFGIATLDLKIHVNGSLLINQEGFIGQIDGPLVNLKKIIPGPAEIVASVTNNHGSTLYPGFFVLEGWTISHERYRLHKE